MGWPFLFVGIILGRQILKFGRLFSSFCVAFLCSGKLKLLLILNCLRFPSG